MGIFGSSEHVDSFPLRQNYQLHTLYFGYLKLRLYLSKNLDLCYIIQATNIYL